MGIVLTNAEALDRRIPQALGMVAGRSFGYKLCWAIADITDAIEKQSKKFYAARKALFQAYGAKKDKDNNYYFDQPSDAQEAGCVTMPEECVDELEKLLDETMEHDIKQTELPMSKKNKDGTDEPIEYEPLIMIALRKFIKRNEV
jgi:hypothetical protein